MPDNTQNLEMNNPSSRRQLIVNLLVLSVFLAGGVWLAGMLAGGRPIPLTRLAGALTWTLYDPDWNSNWTAPLLGQLPYLTFYYVWFFTLTAVWLTLPVLRKWDKDITARRLITTVTVVLLLTVSTLQSVNQFKFHLREARQLVPLNEEEKITRNFGMSYPFAQYCRRHLPGAHNARLITDLDTTIPQQEMTTHALRYYLFPIDFSLNPDQPPDCLVIVSKTDPLKSVEPGFLALEPFDDASLLAVRSPR